MEERRNCEETVGLFVIRNCPSIATLTCANCEKAICKTHSFTKIDPKGGSESPWCLSCFTAADTRLTKDIELYSKDRYVWRRKMIARFHEEYEYMSFMAEEYGGLFMTSSLYDTYDDLHDEGSYFDS